MVKYWLIFFSLLASSIYSQSIVINEVMASNKKTLFDEDGDASDYIELYNKGTIQIDLTGYSLSDDTLKTNKWIFASTIIKPGDHLIVFASSKDRKSGKLHTNFNVSASGESIILCEPKGTLIDRVNVSASAADISYGRTTDGAVSWIFQIPSPGLANTGKPKPDYADQIIASKPGGFYSSSVSVSLSAGTSKIYYTLNGKDPDSTSSFYSSPITITKTSVLKAVSLKKGFSPSLIFYQTYFINETTDLPVISLSSDPYNLFDYNYGIYANGPGWTSADPNFGANFWKDWERPAHVEFYDDAKKLGFSENCALAISGAWSRASAQKSFSVKFKDSFNASPINYKLFPDIDISTFNSFVLRNSGNDFYYTHIRDAMMQTLVENLDIDYQEYRPATTFINGEYWGIYNIREKISEHYVASHHGVDPDNVDMLENNMNVINGDSLSYLKFINSISTLNMATDDAYNYVTKNIDLNECLLYFAAQAYYDNQDWPGNNIKFWRERSETGKWRWILFDLDFGFSLYSHNASEDHIQFMFAPNSSYYANLPWATLLQRKLVANPKIKNQFINQIADLLNTNFKSDRVIATINSMAGHIATELVKHRKKWNIGGESTSKLITFATDRPAYLRTHVRNFFGCGTDGSITVNSTAGGKVKLNSLNLTKANFPWTGIYFQKNAVHLQAIPDPGYKFDGWSGDITSKKDTASLFVSASSKVNATFSVDNSITKDIVINEINYNSPAQFNSGDWIELYNKSKLNIDISNWVFSDSDPTHAFAFPAGTTLDADKYLVVVADSKAFTTLFPSIKNFVGPMDFGLSGSGELIKLMDKNKNVIDSLEYDDQSPWPIEAGGLGATLELEDPSSDNTLAKNWKASSVHGSPGIVNSVHTAISEKENNIPVHFVLNQNYPNPFNPSTTISYQVSAFSHVSLKVFDFLGREVATLVDELKQPGNYQINFNATHVERSRDMPSGIYFYTMQAGTFTKTKKFVLMK